MQCSPSPNHREQTENLERAKRASNPQKAFGPAKPIRQAKFSPRIRKQRLDPVSCSARDKTRDEIAFGLLPLPLLSCPGGQPIDGKRRFSIFNGPWRPRLHAWPPWNFHARACVRAAVDRETKGARDRKGRGGGNRWIRDSWHLRTLPSLASFRARSPSTWNGNSRGEGAPPSQVAWVKRVVRARIFLSWKILRNRRWDHRRPNDYEIYRLLFLVISSFEIEVSRLGKGRVDDGTNTKNRGGGWASCLCPFLVIQSIETAYRYVNTCWRNNVKKWKGVGKRAWKYRVFNEPVFVNFCSSFDQTEVNIRELKISRRKKFILRLQFSYHPSIIISPILKYLECINPRVERLDIYIYICIYFHSRSSATLLRGPNRFTFNRIKRRDVPSPGYI